MKFLGRILLALILTCVSAEANSLHGGSAIPYNPSIQPLTLTAVGVSSYGFYSTRKLDTWSGNAAIVERASDSATLTVGFVNNVIDCATVKTWAAGSATSIQTQFDQSGNGNDATQSTLALQPPVCNLTPIQVNGFDPEFCDGDKYNLPSATTRELVLPSGSVLNTKSMSIFQVSLQGQAERVDAIYTLSTGSSANLLTFFSVGSPDGLYTNGPAGTADNILYPASGQPQVTGFVSSSSNVIYYNGPKTTTKAAYATGGSSVGGKLCNDYTTIDQGDASNLAIITFASPLNSTQVTALQSELNTKYTLNTSFSNVVWYTGDSIANGIETQYQMNVTTQMQPLLSKQSTTKVINFGWPSQTIAGLNTNEASIYTAFNNETIANKVCVLQGGTNDIYNGSTDVQTEAAAEAWATYATGTVGCNYLVIGTLLYRSDDVSNATHKAYKDAYNAYVRANYVAMGFNALADVQANPVMGPITAITNTLLYNTDETHPTGYNGTTDGYSYLAPIWAAAISGGLL